MRILSPSRSSLDIQRRKNCSGNGASNWTPAGHIRARGDRRRWRERGSDENDEAEEGEVEGERETEKAREKEREREREL